MNDEEMQRIHDNVDKQFNHKQLKAAGVNWHYVEFGNPSGPAVLLVHGLPECWYSWHSVIPYLDQEYRILAIDMKGQGRSVSDDNNYEWHHVAAQMAGFMDALGIAKYHIVGHDWGAIITSILVGDFPERILSFTRMEADLFPPGENSDTYKKKPQWLLFKNEAFGKWFLKRTARNGWFTHLCYKGKRVQRILKPISDEDFAYLTFEFARSGVAEAAAAYFFPRNRDMKALFDEIAYNDFPFPVLQLQADSDPSQPKEMFQEIPQLCKNVTLKWVTGASHFSNLDQPEQVAEGINLLISSIGVK
jgi:pimeloyl-ACP methyl ester carboxylesterase